MAITLEELDGLYNDPLMIDLCGSTVAKLAALIVQAEAASQNSQGAERLAFAEGALNNPENAALPIWRYMVGVNTAANAGQITRSIAPSSEPNDASIESNCQEAIDALYPLGT